VKYCAGLTLGTVPRPKEGPRNWFTFPWRS